MCKTTGRRITSGLIMLIALLVCFAALDLGQAQPASASIEIGILACEAPLQPAAANLIRNADAISFAVLPASAPAGQLNAFRNKQIYLIPCLSHYYSIPGSLGPVNARNNRIEQDLLMLRQFIKPLTNEQEGHSVPGVVIATHPNLQNEQVAVYFDALARKINTEFEIPKQYLISNYGLKASDAVRDTLFSFIADPGRSRRAAQITPYNQLPDIESTRYNALADAYVVPYFEHNALRRLKKFLSTVAQEPTPNPATEQTRKVLFRWNDYSRYQQHIPGFTELVDAYNSSAGGPVALPAPEQPSANAHYSALLLLLLWLSFGMHYFFSYTYRRAVKRYHLSHTFFVEDVLDRHVRFTISSLLLLLQTGFMWGLAAYTAVPALLTEAGMNGLSWHYPIIEYNWTLMVIFFMLGTAFHLICVLWLSSSCPRTDGIVQAATLQMWPMHIGLLLITLLVPGVSAGLSADFIQILLLSFFLLNIAAFIVAAIHFSRRPTLPLPLHWLATIVLYTGVLAGTAIYIIYGSTLSEVVQLVLHI